MANIQDVWGATASALITSGFFLAPLMALTGLPPHELHVPAPPPIPIVTMMLELPSEDLAEDLEETPADEVAASALPATREVEEPPVQSKPATTPATPPPAAVPTPPPPPPVKAPPKVKVPKRPTPAAESPSSPPPQLPTRARPVDSPPTDATVSQVAAKKTRPARKGRCKEPHPQIQRVGVSSYEVQDGLIKYYTSKMERLNSLGYSKRYLEGDTKGWLIGGFGCKSPLWQAGLRSHDVVRSVNGKKTYNIVQIFGLWLGQRHKKEFDIVVLRRGKEVRLHYKVV